MSNPDEKFDQTIVETALGAFGVPEEVIEQHLADKNRKEYGRHICICGHPITMHHDVSGRTMCSAAQLYCPCINEQPVLEVGDKRCFMFKSEGIGAKHALMKGLYKAKLAKVKTRLITDRTCFKCSNVSEDLIPAGLNRDFKVIFMQAPYNALFCPLCLEEIMGRPILGFLG